MSCGVGLIIHARQSMKRHCDTKGPIPSSFYQILFISGDKNTKIALLGEGIALYRSPRRQNIHTEFIQWKNSIHFLALYLLIYVDLFQPALFCNLPHEKVYNLVFSTLHIITLSPVVTDYVHQYVFRQG